MDLALHRTGYGFLVGSSGVCLRRFQGSWRVQAFDLTDRPVMEWAVRRGFVDQRFRTRDEAYRCARLALEIYPLSAYLPPGRAQPCGGGHWRLGSGLSARRRGGWWLVSRSGRVVGRTRTLWMACFLAANGKITDRYSAATSR